MSLHLNLVFLVFQNCCFQAYGMILLQKVYYFFRLEQKCVPFERFFHGAPRIEITNVGRRIYPNTTILNPC